MDRRYFDRTVARNNLLYAASGSINIFSAVNDEGQGTTHTVDHNLATTTTSPFVSTSLEQAEDFQITESLSWVDAGFDFTTNIVSIDFGGCTRPAGSGFDLGAWEYGSKECWSQISVFHENL